MTYTREQLQATFQSRFDQNKWQGIIINFFKAKEVYSTPEPLEIDAAEGEGYILGYLDTTDTYRISFFYLKLNRSIDQRKVGLRQLIARYIKIDSDAGIGVFDDGNHWRLSFITDLHGEKTSPKRYTFVFGDNQNQYRTAVDRFMELQHKGISFANIKEAFSVEALTKQFYNDLFEWYTWALDPSTGVYFPENKSMSEQEKKKAPATRLIRLITRMMFVWFIKQKGLVPEALFNKEEVGHWLKEFDPLSTTSGNYYQAILQNLFFATLNRPIKTPVFDKDGNQIGEERRTFARLQGKHDVKSLYRYQELFKISEDKILSIFEFIPFINGGLFECLDKDKTQDGKEAYWEDGFTRNDTYDAKNNRYVNRAFVPNKLFFSDREQNDGPDGLLTVFGRYNFTVEENSPSEQQIALDPELLGKVFENLLGVYNPETHDTARNQSGSFYTPREIVNYMVDISLQAYLGNTDEVKAVFADGFVYDNHQKDFYDTIIEKLKVIKVLDPACGSGAFPMGMLNRIVEIMQLLKAPGSKYDQKLEIMENCIYGGDIQTIAAQITKLRFFISLVCDCEKTNNPDDNYGIPNLPNLETHFVTCDSLIGLPSKAQQSLFEYDIIDRRNELNSVRHEHFMAKTVYQKTKLRNRDKELRDELVRLLTDDRLTNDETAKKMAAWNPYDQNAQASFFDPEWMFGIGDGFDVVIGNPPYIQLQAEGGKLGDLYKSLGYKTFAKTGDIYCLFYEQGYNLLRERGHLCYITSNKWMRAGYGEKTRGFFAEKTNPCLLIDFAGVKIFESATVDTNILLFEKAKNALSTRCVVTTKDAKDSLNNLSDYVQQHLVSCTFRDSSSWVILSPIEQSIKSKIEALGKPLCEWDLSINYGIKTGYNDAFIVTSETRENILSNCETSEEKARTEDIIRPILRGRDIQKYAYKWADLWLINTHNGVKGQTPRINIDEYPAIKRHLQQYWEKIVSRDDQGDTPYNLRNCAYLDEFSKPKILWKRIGSILRFSYDNTGKMGLDSTCFATGSHIAYLCCLFNSRMGRYMLQDAPKTGTGDLLISVQAVEPLRVPEISDSENSKFQALLEDVINNNISEKIIEKIDNEIYSIYKLNNEEKEFINSLSI